MLQAARDRRHRRWRSAGVGASILRNLLASCRGRVYPVNPHTQAIDGVACHATLAEVPSGVDLAVIAVPAAAVDRAVDDCIKANVAGIVVISAGFGETGDEGRRRSTRASRHRCRWPGGR